MTPASRAQLTRILATFAAAGGPDRFDVGAFDHAADRMSLRDDWTRGQIWRAAGWMAGRNASGSSIYLRPACALEAHPWVLVDDLSAAALEKVRKAHPPGIVVETSPRSFQAWIRVTRPVRVETRTDIARTLAQTYGTDPGGVGGNQFGRCPGTTNQKPERRREDGRAPFATLRHAGGEVVEIAIPEETAPTRPPARAAGERTAGVDQSRRDFGMACRLIEAGHNDDEIARAIRAVRLQMGDPKGLREDYVERTIRAAHQHTAAPRSLRSYPASASTP